MILVHVAVARNSSNVAVRINCNQIVLKCYCRLLSNRSYLLTFFESMRIDQLIVTKTAFSYDIDHLLQNA